MDKREFKATITFSGPKGKPITINVDGIKPDGSVNFTVSLDVDADKSEFDYFHTVLASMFEEILNNAQIAVMEKDEVEETELGKMVSMTNLMGGPIGEA